MPSAIIQGPGGCQCSGPCDCASALAPVGTDPLVATYNGRTYNLTYANPHIAAAISGFVGWANDTAVNQPTSHSTSSTLTPCADGCGNNGDVPTWLTLSPSCGITLRVQRACGCPDVSHNCWYNGPGLLPREAYAATSVTQTCSPTSISGTFPVNVNVGSGCSFLNTLPLPGGGGAVTITP